MDRSILLFDGSHTLEQKLTRQGFGVSSARLGYAGSRTVLPAPVYEYDTIIYNPLREARQTWKMRSTAATNMLGSIT
jgi:hypothetical protein